VIILEVAHVIVVAVDFVLSVLEAFDWLEIPLEALLDLLRRR
jgi:uncharacterized protein (DUF2384 family)